MKEKLPTLSVFAVLILLFAFAANDFRIPGMGAARPEGIDWCEAHNVAEEACETCNPDLARGGTAITSIGEPQEGVCPNTQKQIALAPGTAAQIDLKTAEARLEAIDEHILANGEIHYMPERHARVAPRLSGVVGSIEVRMGQEVVEGDLLAKVDSAPLGQAKADYLEALAVREMWKKTYARQKALFDKKIATQKDLLEAEVGLTRAALSVDRAAQKLSNYGLTSAGITKVAKDRDASPGLAVTAPFDGIVVSLRAVPGEMADPARPLFGIADMSMMWLSIDVYEYDLSRVEPGQRIWFRVEGLKGKRFPGRIIAIGSEVDHRTRTVPVFATVKNVGGLLRANMFGKAQVRVREKEPKLLIPKEAAQNDGDCDLVFTAPLKDIYQARKVELGRTYGDAYEIVSGLRQGEVVVTTGSFQLKTEVLRGQIGAG